MTVCNTEQVSAWKDCLHLTRNENLGLVTAHIGSVILEMTYFMESSSGQLVKTREVLSQYILLGVVVTQLVR